MLNRNAIPRRRMRAATAFTLIEILVVVAIIVVLIGIFIPIVGSAKKHAMNNATVAQLHTITTALTQYYTNFNMFPASTTPAYTNVNNANFPNTGIIPTGRATCLLAQALMGYLPYDVDGCGPTVYSATPPGGASSNPSDPQFGFRANPGGNGRIYGPYVSSDPNGYKINSAYDQCFIDSFGYEILYYHVSRVSTPTKVFDTLASNDSVFYTDDDANSYPASSPAVLLNADRTVNPGPASGSSVFFSSLGMKGNTISATNPTTSLLGKDSYILISAGTKGKYFDDDDIVATKP